MPNLIGYLRVLLLLMAADAARWEEQSLQYCSALHHCTAPHCTVILHCCNAILHRMAPSYCTAAHAGTALLY